MSFKKILTGFALAGGILVAGSAAAFPIFTVDANGISAGDAGTVNPFQADKIIGNYFEVITFGAGTFNVELLWTGGQFSDTATATTYTAGQTGLGVNYGLYALFTGSGTWSTSGGTTTFSLTPGGSLSVFYDDNADTTSNGFPVDASTAWSLSNTADDIQIASGTGTAGSGSLTCSTGNNCGSFGQVTSFTLMNGGSNFFTIPNPFYNFSLQNGQFNGFSVSAGATQKLNGSADVEFQTPEPSILALMGLGLVGLAMVRRKGSKGSSEAA